MNEDGSVEVHDNVVFKANTAEENGGAVSLPIDLHFVLPNWCFAMGYARLDLIR